MVQTEKSKTNFATLFMSFIIDININVGSG